MKACLFAIDAGFRRDRHAAARDDLGDIFENGGTLSGQSDRGVLLLGVAFRRSERRPQLRGRRRADAGLRSRRCRTICRTPASVAIRTPACPTGSAGSIGDKDHTAAVLGEFAAERLAEPRRRLLRHDPGMDRGDRQGRRGRAARVESDRARTGPLTAGSMPLVIRPETNFVMVGERTNITGSKRFARLIESGDYEAALIVARDQVEDGANIIDVNMDEGLIDGEKAMTRFLNLIVGRADDRQGADDDRQLEMDVIEAGPEVRSGEVDRQLDQPEGRRGRVPRQARLVHRYGAAVVVMAFDEQGQAVTKDHKVAICARACKLLTEEVGFDPSDIIFDANILTVGTGSKSTTTTRSSSSRRSGS